jgi:hypothetical protein
MSIRLKKPYKIVAYLEKTYDEHYAIPSSKTLVVPIKLYDREAQCDVRWQADDGQMYFRSNMMFSTANLVALDRLRDFELFEIFQHYYQDQGSKA